MQAFISAAGLRLRAHPRDPTTTVPRQVEAPEEHRIFPARDTTVIVLAKIESFYCLPFGLLLLPSFSCPTLAMCADYDRVVLLHAFPDTRVMCVSISWQTMPYLKDHGNTVITTERREQRSIPRSDLLRAVMLAI
jgi:hypothetical protein